jgi:hypothetical protein
MGSTKHCLRKLHTVSWKVEKHISDQNILYIDIFIEEWNQMSCIEQYFENQKL